MRYLVLFLLVVGVLQAYSQENPLGYGIPHSDGRWSVVEGYDSFFPLSKDKEDTTTRNLIDSYSDYRVYTESVEYNFKQLWKNYRKSKGLDTTFTNFDGCITRDIIFDIVGYEASTNFYRNPIGEDKDTLYPIMNFDLSKKDIINSGIKPRKRECTIDKDSIKINTIFFTDSRIGNHKETGSYIMAKTLFDNLMTIEETKNILNKDMNGKDMFIIFRIREHCNFNENNDVVNTYLNNNIIIITER